MDDADNTQVSRASSEDEQTLASNDGLHAQINHIWSHTVSSVLSACNICHAKPVRGDGEAEDDERSIAPGWLSSFYPQSVEEEEEEDETLAQAEASMHPSQEVSREDAEDLLATLMGSTEEPHFEGSVRSSRYSYRGSDRRLVSVQDPDGMSTKSPKSSFRTNRTPRGSSRNVRLGVQYDEEDDMYKHMVSESFPVCLPKCVNGEFDLDNPEHMKQFEEEFAPKIKDSAHMAKSLGEARQRKAITDHDVNMLMKGFNIDSNYELRIERAKEVTEENIEFQNHEMVQRNMENFDRHLARSGLKYAESQMALRTGMTMNYKAIFLERDPHFNRHSAANASHNARMKRKETSKKLTTTRAHKA